MSTWLIKLPVDILLGDENHEKAAHWVCEMQMIQFRFKHTSGAAAHCVFKRSRRYMPINCRCPVRGGAEIRAPPPHSFYRSFPLLSSSLPFAVEPPIRPTLAAILRRTNHVVKKKEKKKSSLVHLGRGSCSRVLVLALTRRHTGQNGEEEKLGRQRAGVRERSTVPHPDLLMEADQVSVRLGANG